MTDKSGRNRDEELTLEELEAAIAAQGLPLRPGEGERILSTARFLRGSAARIHAALDGGKEQAA